MNTMHEHTQCAPAPRTHLTHTACTCVLHGMGNPLTSICVLFPVPHKVVSSTPPCINPASTLLCFTPCAPRPEASPHELCGCAGRRAHGQRHRHRPGHCGHPGLAEGGQPAVPGRESHPLAPAPCTMHYTPPCGMHGHAHGMGAVGWCAWWCGHCERCIWWGRPSCFCAPLSPVVCCRAAWGASRPTSRPA